MKKQDDSQSTVTLNMEEILSLQDGEPLKLEQVAGLGQGRTFRLLPLQEIIIGREAISGIYLDEKLVSRRHAKLSYRQKQPEVVDLGSANGTVVNGKRVKQASLRNGDRLEVGTSAFEISIGTSSSASSPDLSVRPETLKLIRQALAPEQAKKTKSSKERSAFSGRLREINIMSLLQTLAANRSQGSLLLRYPTRTGAIYLADGEVVHATFENVVGPKALYRMVALEEGEFEFMRPGREPEQHTIEGGLEKHLLEGARHMDELPAYREQLPDNTARLVFVRKQVVELAEVPPTVLEVLAVIGRVQMFGSVIELSPLPDLDVCRIVLMLIERGIVEVVQESEQVTELTRSPARR